MVRLDTEDPRSTLAAKLAGHTPLLFPVQSLDHKSSNQAMIHAAGLWVHYVFRQWLGGFPRSVFLRLMQILSLVAFLVAGTGPSAVADLTAEEKQAVTELQRMHQELTENKLFGASAVPYIAQFRKSLSRKAAASLKVQLAIAVVQIDRGVNVRREAVTLATRMKTSWAAWKTALVAELVFGDADEAILVVARFQRAVLSVVNAEETDPAVLKDCRQQLLWVKDATNQLAILPDVSESGVNRIVNNPEAEDVINANDQQEIASAAEARRDKDADFAVQLKATLQEQTEVIGRELDSLETAIPNEMQMLSAEYIKKLTELKPLGAAVSAARAVSSAAESAVSSINSRLSAARSKANSIDEDEEPGAKIAAEAAVDVLEGQLAAARADAAAARAEESRAESVYCLKLGESQRVYATAANVVNFAKHRVLLLRREFEGVISDSIAIQERFRKIEVLIGRLLQDFPPMPTFVRRKTSREMALEETRMIAKKLQISVKDVFAEISR
ncbi:MAG: hypothetical protein ACK5TG_17640 [Planctomyces sp.]